jgi:hypothetical protein
MSRRGGRGSGPVAGGAADALIRTAGRLDVRRFTVLTKNSPTVAMNSSGRNFCTVVTV